MRYNARHNSVETMSHPEEGRYPAGAEPLFPIALPPDLAEFLRTQDIACLMQATDQGTAHVIKLPAAEIASVRGTVPIAVRHELHAHPAAPVIRTVIAIYDQPHNPLALETYTNIADEQQRADFAALAEQDRLMLLFYDEGLRHRLNKVVPYRDPDIIRMLVARAEQLLAAIPEDRRDFNRAKADVLERTHL